MLWGGYLTDEELAISSNACDDSAGPPVSFPSDTAAAAAAAAVQVGDWICGVLGRESQSRVGLARLAGLKAAAEAAALRDALSQKQLQLTGESPPSPEEAAATAKALAELERGDRSRSVALCWPQLPQELLKGAAQPLRDLP